mmetsp:Transcript_23328/g.48037  ORF Transcript_23328/g.48037 Transcript_23328/m.48037 type:complete len:82 (+) Transcript_23328:486-731(+)
MCSYLNQLELADWINRLQIDASDPLSGKGWEVLVVLAAAFRKAAEQKAQRTSRRLDLAHYGRIRAFLGASLRDLFPKELDT